MSEGGQLYGKDFQFIKELIDRFNNGHDPSYETLLRENLRLRARMSWIDAKTRELIAGFEAAK